MRTKRARKPAIVTSRDPNGTDLFATREELLDACIAQGATRISPMQESPRWMASLYRPSASFADCWATCVLFQNSVDGLWERGSWILDCHTAQSETPRESTPITLFHFEK